MAEPRDSPAALWDEASPSQREGGLGCVHKLCHACSLSQNSAPSFSSRDGACGDRQQKGKLALIWHVDSCSSGTKGGPSAHCVWHEVRACIPKHPALDSSLALHVEMPLRLQGLSWETGDCIPLCWVSLFSGQKRHQSSPPGIFLIIPAFPGSLRQVPVLHGWVCHCRFP